MTQPVDPHSGRAQVEAIKEKVSIVDIISRYVQLTRAGKSLRGCCPLHGEKTPSFYVSPDEGYWKCFGCGKGGDVIKFVEEIEKVSFREALTYLAEIAGIELRFSSQSSATASTTSGDTALYAILAKAKSTYVAELQKTPEAIDYLQGRGVSQEMIQSFQLGFAPDGWQTIYNSVRREYNDENIIASGVGIQGKKGVYDRFRSRIMFPTHDIRDRVITFSGRLWSPTGEYQTEKPDAGKYVNGPESVIYHKSRTLYGLNLARQSAVQKKRMIIVEGHLDCVLSHQAGLTETVAIGGTAFTDEHALIIKRYCDHVVLAFDGDAAGYKAILRTLPILFKNDITVGVARFPNKMDPADMAAADPAGYRNTIESATDYVSFRLKVLQSEGLSLTDIDRVLRQEVYPLLSLIQNQFLLNAAIDTIARAIGVQADVVQEHIRQVMKHSDLFANNTSQMQQSEAPPPSTVRDFALRLATVWREIESKYPDEYKPEKVIDYIKGATGIQASEPAALAELYSIQYAEYGLRFGWLYGDQSPVNIMPVIIKQFAESYIRDTMQRHIHALHQAVDETERQSLESLIVELSHYKRYSETHMYAN